MLSVSHSCPQSCDPFGQRHGSRALAGSETGSPRITDFRLSAQPHNFKTIAVIIGYENGQLLRLRLILAPPELSIRGASQKDRSECPCL